MQYRTHLWHHTNLQRMTPPMSIPRWPVYLQLHTCLLGTMCKIRALRRLQAHPVLVHPPHHTTLCVVTLFTLSTCKNIGIKIGQGLGFGSADTDLLHTMDGGNKG